MASIQELKKRIDLHDLCRRLGLDRPGGDKGNYKSPHHDDKTPSLSVTPDGNAWKDFSSDARGSIIDLVMYVDGIAEVGEAVKRLHELYDIPPDPPPNDGQKKKKNTVEYVADNCLKAAEKSMGYLVKERKILPEVVEQAIARRSLGFNEWHSPKLDPGSPMYGGPAVAFIVRSLNTGNVVAVDTRYVDAALNGGVKTQCIGAKDGHVWTSCPRKLGQAGSVFVFEAPINALTAECAKIPNSAAIAVRGINVEGIDWRFLMGKEVFICMDNDVQDDRGNCPGPRAAWRLLELLTALDIAAHIIDQKLWDEDGDNDLNDILQHNDREEVSIALKRLEPWLIQGKPGKLRKGKPCRIFLPPHDHEQHWRFRTQKDFTRYIKTEETDDNGNVEVKFQDVCGYRIASISRVRVAGAQSVMTGEVDTQPKVLFAASVQAPRHGPVLQRRVFDDDQLHNLARWEKFGPIYAPIPFKRMVNILERGAHLGARDAVNFVGLAWRDGKPVVNEGPDCYFMDPDKQCAYSKMTFPSGSKADARKVIAAYQATYGKNAAAQLLVWSLGCHLKAFLGFWPHMMIQAKKGSGKTTLIKKLESTISFTMFSTESIKTLFRILTTVSHTSQPVGWEEFSALNQRVIDEAVGVLQQTYQYVVTRRGSEMTEYLQCAPVLLAGEDVPVRDIHGKIVRVDLAGLKGDMLPMNLPKFPVLQWLHYLADLSREQVMSQFDSAKAYALRMSRASDDDDGAKRMAGNYAAVMMAWKYLCDFSGIAFEQGDFSADMVTTMNAHIGETSSDREPWIWILEIAFSDIDRGEFRFPYCIEEDVRLPDKRECLFIRTQHIMDHIRHTPALRARWDSLSVKSNGVFRRQLDDSGVIARSPVEKTIAMTRVSNMVALDLAKLEQFNLHVTRKMMKLSSEEASDTPKQGELRA